MEWMNLFCPFPWLHETSSAFMKLIVCEHISPRISTNSLNHQVHVYEVYLIQFWMVFFWFIRIQKTMQNKQSCFEYFADKKSAYHKQSDIANHFNSIFRWRILININFCTLEKLWITCKHTLPSFQNWIISSYCYA